METTTIASCDRVYKAELAALIIEDANDKDEQSPRAEFLVMLRPGSWIYLVVFLLSFGTLLASVSPDLLKSLQSFLGTTNPLVQYHQTAAYIIKFVGVIMVGTGAFIGFRTLPYT
jgi:hypothetical protein